MKIIFIVASLEQARCIKRVNSIYNAGFDVEVYGHSRGCYSISGYREGIKVHDIGQSENGGNHLKKFLSNFAFINKLVTDTNRRKEGVLYYAFAFDLALSLFIRTKSRYIYEISDIIYAYYKSTFIRKIFLAIDRLLIKKSFRTVMTSEGFANYIFSGKERPDNVIIQPNKVSPQLLSVKRKPLADLQEKQITFSYVGMFRYPNTIFRLARIIGESYPQYRFLFYGSSVYLTPLAISMSEKYDNVEYLGPFKSPDDLEKIYSTIDVVAACYDSSQINVQIAEPNKLYEAICFCKPILVSNHTFLGEKVERMGLGYTIDATSDENIKAFLDNLSPADLEKISQDEYKLKEDEYVDSPKSIINSLLVLND